jgi:hypothetical protein
MLILLKNLLQQGRILLLYTHGYFPLSRSISSAAVAVSLWACHVATFSRLRSH